MASEIFTPAMLRRIKVELDRGTPASRIAHRLSVTTAHISNAKILAEADPHIHQLIADGLISPTSAILALRASDPLTVISSAQAHATRRGAKKIRHSDVQAVMRPRDEVKDALLACVDELRRLGAGESASVKNAMECLK